LIRKGKCEIEKSDGKKRIVKNFSENFNDKKYPMDNPIKNAAVTRMITTSLP